MTSMKKTTPTITNNICSVDDGKEVVALATDTSIMKNSIMTNNNNDDNNNDDNNNNVATTTSTNNTHIQSSSTSSAIVSSKRYQRLLEMMERTLSKSRTEVDLHTAIRQCYGQDDDNDDDSDDNNDSENKNGYISNSNSNSNSSTDVFVTIVEGSLNTAQDRIIKNIITTMETQWNVSKALYRFECSINKYNTIQQQQLYKNLYDQQDAINTAKRCKLIVPITTTNDNSTIGTNNSNNNNTNTNIDYTYEQYMYDIVSYNKYILLQKEYKQLQNELQQLNNDISTIEVNKNQLSNTVTSRIQLLQNNIQIPFQSTANTFSYI